MRSRWTTITAVILSLYLAACWLGGVLLAEMQLHPPRMPIRYSARFESDMRRLYHSNVQEVSANGRDNVILRAWYVKPKNDNGSSVLLLHGVADNREGVSGYARMFLDQGYRVLLPDSRAHGISGGDIATYGLKEADDIHRWVDWLEAGETNCVYGFGESMGAALLLQSLAHESRFCAVVVESAFSRFDEVAPERAARYTRMPFWFGRTVERPIIAVAMAYTRWKYGLDFRQANPADAVAHTTVPVLLITGSRDLDILPHHSEALARADDNAQLWIVEGAAHGGASSANPQLFESRVLQFFCYASKQPGRPVRSV